MTYGLSEVWQMQVYRVQEYACTVQAVLSAIHNGQSHALQSVLRGPHVCGLCVLDVADSSWQLQAAAAAATAAANSSEDETPTEGLVITGWMALAAVAALVLVLVGVAYGVYQRFFSPTRNYTLVVKNAGGT